MSSRPPTLDVTGLAGFEDIPEFDDPPIGNFVFVDQAFIPIAKVRRGTKPILIVTTDGDPPVSSYWPVTVTIYNAINGRVVWTHTSSSPADEVCPDLTGCSIDGPSIDEILSEDVPADPLLVQAHSGGDLLARAGWIPTNDSNNIGVDIDDELGLIWELALAEAAER